MGILNMNKINCWSVIFVILYYCIQNSAQEYKNTEYYAVDNVQMNDILDYKINIHRQKRDVNQIVQNVTKTQQPQNNTNASGVTLNATKTSENYQPTNNSTKPQLLANVSNQMPLLGVNGSGIRKDIPNEPKVSDPIQPDDSGFNLSTIFKETPEMIKNEHNLTNVKYDNHTFYNSTFITDEKYFKQYWTNITTGKHDIHASLSNSHRRATTLKLSFDFPFYGQPLNNITVATGGFIYMGEQVHSWLAATQYVAPLMANFDTRLTNDSVVKLYDDGTKFTAIWENVNLQENVNNTFTFAVTLMKNGDIIFAYKNIPIPITEINDKEHPVKVGISDAYLTDKILFYVRRKTIYEYHRVSFLNYEIKNFTILKLTALPTCLQYNTCESCTNHQTGFNCSWCAQIQRCSSGIDRNKQDWMVRNCDKYQISNSSLCPATAQNKTGPSDTSTTYVTDTKTNPYHETVVKSVETPKKKSHIETIPDDVPSSIVASTKSDEEAGSSPLGGLVAAFITVVLVSSVAAWMIYAFKNPHTRSGQFFIKYRPSQWSWKRGEARYTAATIHM